VLPKRSLASGDIAIDKLPIPPDLASGEIVIKGTAVLCNLSLVCAVIELATKHTTTHMAILIRGIRIIHKCFKILYK
jgi:hypothetical protein